MHSANWTSRKSLIVPQNILYVQGQLKGVVFGHSSPPHTFHEDNSASPDPFHDPGGTYGKSSKSDSNKSGTKYSQMGPNCPIRLQERVQHRNDLFLMTRYMAQLTLGLLAVFFLSLQRG